MAIYDRHFLQPFLLTLKKHWKNLNAIPEPENLGKTHKQEKLFPYVSDASDQWPKLEKDENVRYAGLLKGQLMETITLEEALDLFKFPRQLGEYEDKPVSVGIGRFGPYIKHNQLFVSLKKGIDEPGQ